MKKIVSNFKNVFGFISKDLDINRKISIIEWTIKLWLLTIAIPISSTIVAIFLTIMGFAELDFSKLVDFIYQEWIGFYISGYLLGIIAWKIHLGILFLSFIFSASTNYENP